LSIQLSSLYFTSQTRLVPIAMPCVPKDGMYGAKMHTNIPARAALK
jgi:hypothetical protein